jgi:predicted O-methyltransferase YrrM
MTARILAEHARRADVRSRLIEALERLANDDCDCGRVERFRQTLIRGAAHADLLDNATVAHAAAELLRPERALEVGVRRGFTCAAIATGCPTVELHLVDSWRPIYAERPNPGPQLVHRQLDTVGHLGRRVTHQGDSHSILPRLFDDHPDLAFDLIVIDGDHTESGADQDLADAFPRVAPKGVLIFDDLVHPSHRYLLSLWRRWRDRLAGEFSFAEYLNDGLGVGWAVRRAA